MKEDLIKFLNSYNFISYEDKEEFVVYVNENVNKEQLIDFLNKFYQYEIDNFSDKEFYIKLSLKKLNTELLIEAFKFILTKDDIIDPCTTLNIINLIKTYNSLDDSFFENKDVYFNSIVDYVDTKLEIKPLLKEFIKKFTLYFYSVIRSCNKITISNEDKIMDIPNMYLNIFKALDFMSLCGIAATCNDLDLKDCGYVVSAREILYNSMQDYFIGNTLLNNFLEGM